MSWSSPYYMGRNSLGCVSEVAASMYANIILRMSVRSYRNSQILCNCTVLFWLMPGTFFNMHRSQARPMSLESVLNESNQMLSPPAHHPTPESRARQSNHLPVHNFFGRVVPNLRYHGLRTTMSTRNDIALRNLSHPASASSPSPHSSNTPHSMLASSSTAPRDHQGAPKGDLRMISNDLTISPPRTN